jgi:hypothetical protein
VDGGVISSSSFDNGWVSGGVGGGGLVSGSGDGDGQEGGGD